MKNLWKTISKNTIFEDRFGYKLRSDDVVTPHGKEGKYTVLEGFSVVAIVAIDSQNKVVMENIWRYPINQVSFEIPAGKVEENETPLESAKRELLEETGYRSEDWQEISFFYSGNGVMNMPGHIFLAKNITAGNKTSNPDSNEIVEVKLTPYSELLSKIKSKEITDARSIIGLLSAKEFIQ
jgi:ADP-ribose pyrophosphatase